MSGINLDGVSLMAFSVERPAENGVSFNKTLAIIHIKC